MSYSFAEVEKLRQYTKEILDEYYRPVFQELKKKLAEAEQLHQEHLKRIENLEEGLIFYKKCHDCHRINVQFQHAQTQASFMPVQRLNQDQRVKEADMSRDKTKNKARSEEVVKSNDKVIAMEVEKQEAKKKDERVVEEKKQVPVEQKLKVKTEFASATEERKTMTAISPKLPTIPIDKLVEMYKEKPSNSKLRYEMGPNESPQTKKNPSTPVNEPIPVIQIDSD